MYSRRRGTLRCYPAAMLVCLLVCFLVTGCSKSSEPATVSVQAKPTLFFTDITQEAGLADFVHNNGSRGDKWYPETVGAGGGFIDYDKDGWLDILLVEGGSWENGQGSATTSNRDQSLRLYRNQGDGTFSDKTRAAGLADVATYAFGVTIADYNNDGYDDFFLTTLYKNYLFKNVEGRFIEVGEAASVSDHALWSTAALFFDADRDGWLDLFVANYINWTPENDIWCTHNGTDKSFCGPKVYEGVRSYFYRSNGDGTFSEASESAGLKDTPGKTLGVAELDFNKDGWPDLVVANDTQRDLLYQNNGDGIFEEIGLYSGVSFDENGVARAGMGIDAGDVDNNGHVSVFVANYSEEMIGVYRHTREGIFANRSAASQIGRPSLTTLGFGLFLFDPNLDGYLDLFVANGHIDDLIEQIQDNVTYRQAPQLFINRRNGTFEELQIEGSELLTRKIVGRGAAFGDIDRDGDQDILIVENAGPVHLWRNNSVEGYALRVSLTGRKSNANGIGAEVLAYVAGEPQSRRIRTGGSYLSQSERVATIGLGMHRQADSVIVSWPSGQVDRFGGVPGGQAIRITEGMDEYTTMQVFNRQAQ